MNEYREKLPFYMAFPMQSLYVMEMAYEKDMERMKELYPVEVKQILPYIEKRCNELEYEGSRMYDENPDMRMMQEEVERLYEQIQKEEHMEQPVEKQPPAYSGNFDFSMPQWEAEDAKPLQGAVVRKRHKDWLYSLVGLLFQDEIYRRRCRHRRCKRWW